MTVATGTGTDTRTWVAAALIKTLADHGIRKPGDQFTTLDVRAWCAEQLQPNQLVHATTRLGKNGFVTRQAKLVETTQGIVPIKVYTVTAAGAMEIQFALEGGAHTAGPRGHRGPNQPDPNDLISRTWRLLRIRKAMTAYEGADTLCDAGEQDYDRVRESIAQYLRRWVRNGVVKPAEKRIGKERRVRFVLVKDSPHPPRAPVQPLARVRKPVEGPAA